MIKGGKGGGKTVTGLKFEKRTDVVKVLTEIEGYSILGDLVLFNGNQVALYFKKRGLYKKFLGPKKVNWTRIVSKTLEPDGALLVLKTKTLYVIEQKYQGGAGSVDEKLQTCDFKKKQYQKLLAPLEIKVEYVYILCDWFKDKKYQDTLDYVKSVGCHYFFNEVPLEFLGLPVGSEKKKGPL